LETFKLIRMDNWISVKDRLPKIECEVLVYSKENLIQIVSYNIRNDLFINYELIYDDVTHWMPLPKPPKDNG